MTTTAAPLGAPSATAAPPAPEPEPERKDSVWQWLWEGLGAGLLAVILGIGVVAIAVPRLTGSVPLTVLTQSMEPRLPPGTMLVVRPLQQNQMGEIRVGDVISYQPYPNNPTLISHRVVATASRADGTFDFTTKGDANTLADPTVQQKQVRAKLWYSVPLLGWVNEAVNTDGHRSWIVPTAAGLLFAYAGYTVVSAVVVAHKKKQDGGPDDAATASSAPE